MAYRVYSTEAVVIHRWPQKEASTRLLLFTKNLGRIIATAQGVRKVGAKLAGALQVGSTCEVELVCGKSGWRVVGASSGRSLLLGKGPHVRSSVERFFRLFSRLVPDQQIDPPLFTLIKAGLEKLARSGNRETAELVEKLLVFRTLVLLGYAPDPEARELEQFLTNRTFTTEQLLHFKPFSGQATAQINRSLSELQL